MALQAPTGIQARFTDGWAYLTVPPQPGMTVEVEFSAHGAPFHACSQFGTEHLVPMYQEGTNIKTQWRARYKRGDQFSAWTTGDVWAPDGFTENAHDKPQPDPNPDPTPTPPATPTGLHVERMDTTAGTATVAWNAAADATHWQVSFGSQWLGATEPVFTTGGLDAGKSYTVQVKAFNDAGASAPASVTFQFGEQPKPPDPIPDPDPVPGGKPGKPQNVRAHCIAYDSAKVEWDRDPAVHEYEVWVDGAADAAQTTQDTLVKITGLKQNTRYTAHVVAHTRDGQSSEPGSVSFTTGLPEPTPDPDPDTDTGADWPAPELMVVPLENGKVRATWRDPEDGSKPKSWMGYPFWHVSLDQQTWYFTRERQYEFEVTAGAEVMVSVYGVWDNTLTAIATKGVAL